MHQDCIWTKFKCFSAVHCNVHALRSSAVNNMSWTTRTFKFLEFLMLSCIFTTICSPVRNVAMLCVQCSHLGILCALQSPRSQRFRRTTSIHFVNLLERTFHGRRTDLDLFAPFCNLGTGMIRSRKKLLVKDPREASSCSIHHLLNALHLAGQLHGIPSVDCQE